MSKVNSMTYNITVSDNVFTPSDLSVHAGDSVKWTWLGPRSHTTTCDGVTGGSSLPFGAATWDSPMDAGSPVFIYPVMVAGVYNYICMFHYTSGMTGRITADEPLPVELTDFVATTIKNEVILDWVTGGEVNNDRFEIQRISMKGQKGESPEDLSFMTVGVLNGNGNINHDHNYKFIDRNLKSGIYQYRLRQVDFNGNYVYHLLNEKIVIGIPVKFIVSQNYPNPFNPSTKINYELPEDGFVKLSLFDMTGKLVSTIVNTNETAGYQAAEFNGSSFASGAYYYTLEFKGANVYKSMTKKMILVK